MGFFDFFKRAQDPVAQGNVLTQEGIVGTEDLRLTAFLSDDILTKQKVLEIPSVKACLNLIKGAVRETPLKLYEKDDSGQIKEVFGDKRVFLLNNDTGDTLTSSQFWDALVEDYYVLGSGYAYINRRRNEIKSLHYVESEDVVTIKNYDPIFKDYNIIVRDKSYLPCDFFKILRDTKDGSEGTGILHENPTLLKVCYNSLKYENHLVATGGNKKGFLKSARTLTDDAIRKLKQAWRRLFTTDEENVVVLNNGLEFQESTNTSVEMQLNENKQTNGAEVAKLFNIPLGMLSGTGTSVASEDDKLKFVDYCMLPFFKTITSSLNRDLLLEEEKGRMFFDFDTKELKKGSLLQRMQAYQIAIKNNVMLTNECRKIENLPAIDFDYIKLDLGSVLYDSKTKEIIVPNTGEKAVIGKKEKSDKEVTGDEGNAENEG